HRSGRFAIRPRSRSNTKSEPLRGSGRSTPGQTETLQGAKRDAGGNTHRPARNDDLQALTVALDLDDDGFAGRAFENEGVQILLSEHARAAVGDDRVAGQDAGRRGR